MRFPAGRELVFGGIAGVVLIVGLTSPGATAPSDDIRGYCASVHQSYRYRLICEQEEKAARERLYRQVGLPYGIPRDIWDYCGGVHSSWRYMEICAREELRAKGLLERQ